jgi:type II secretory pathway predicted ATPase ExeA/LysM repeat protein
MSHQEAIASLIYGIYERKGFMAITGEVGTGKTTILHYLMTVLDPKTKAIFICQTQITFEELLKEILTELNLSPGDANKSAMIRRLKAYLLEILEQDKNLVILIDEAQNLSNDVLEELRMLSNLETGEAKLLQIVLVGQPELENKLNLEGLRQLKQRIGIRRQIKPLPAEESRQYIEHRLNHVGSSSAAVFTPEALSMICQYAQGIPRTINILCDNALLIGYGLQQKVIDANIIREVLNDLGISIPERQARPKKVYRPESILQGNYERPALVDEDETISTGKSRAHIRRVSYLIIGIIGLAVIFFLSREYFMTPPDSPVPKPSLSPPVVAEKVAPPEPASPAPKSLQPAPVVAAPKAAPKTQHQATKIIGVAKGGTLYSISQKYYNLANATLIDHILEFNPKIDNIHLIQVNQKIKIPEIEEESLLLASSAGGYQVHLGTFYNPKEVRRYKNEPALRGKDIEVIPRQVSPEETWYRVVAGKFETREEALKMIQALREKRLLPILQHKE